MRVCNGSRPARRVFEELPFGTETLMFFSATCERQQTRSAASYRVWPKGAAGCPTSIPDTGSAGLLQTGHWIGAITRSHLGACSAATAVTGSAENARV